MYDKIFRRAMDIQRNNLLDLAKKEKEYAFTFIYPPSEVLHSLKHSPYDNTEITAANLYIHIPYCTGRCSYCYFGCYSLSRAPVDKSKYVDLICEEMRMVSKKLGKIEILSIHFGGGTPTTLTIAEIERIFSSIRKCFHVKNGIEITFESSPETVTPDKINVLIANGVNRFNVGVQTLNDDILKSLQRRHNSQEALGAIEILKNCGLKNINVDIMYGLRGQTMENWIETINGMISCGVQSISAYRLRIHPYGKLADQVCGFDEERTIRMYIKLMEIMHENSYFQCSSHKFALKEELAQKQITNKRGIKNNMLLPLGMAAYGYIGNTLFWNERNMEGYERKIRDMILPYSIGYHLDKEEEKAKACVLGIHNVRGINFKDYKEYFGESIQEKYGNLIRDLSCLGLVDLTNDGLKPNALGMVFADEIATKFYSEKIKKQLQKRGKKYGIFFDDILQE